MLAFPALQSTTGQQTDLSIIGTVLLPWLQSLLLALRGLLVHMLVAIETVAGIFVAVAVEFDQFFDKCDTNLWVLGDDALDALADVAARCVEAGEQVSSIPMIEAGKAHVL